MYGNEEYIQEMVERMEARRSLRGDGEPLEFWKIIADNLRIQLFFRTNGNRWIYTLQMTLATGWIRYGYYRPTQTIADATTWDVGLCTSRVASLAMEALKENKKE